VRLRLVSDNKPPKFPKGIRISARASAIIALLIIGAIAGGIWWLSHWFSDPVSAAYLRQQSASFNKCEKQELSRQLSPITRYTLRKARSLCAEVESGLKTIQDQQDSLGNLQ